MKKIILYIAMLLVYSMGAVAQEPSHQDSPARQAPTPQEQMKMFVDRISPKLSISKTQKDSLSIIFLKFMDDIQKYHAENNEKVISFMTKNRDDKVKNLLRDSTKFTRYLIILSEISKQAETQPNSMERQRHGGEQNPGMGGNRTF